MGHELSQQELELVMSKLDTSGDGRVAFDEFLLWWGVGLSLEALLDAGAAEKKREKVRQGGASMREMAERSARESTAALEQQAAADAERSECRETYHRPRRASIAANLKDRPARERGAGMTPRQQEPGRLPSFHGAGEAAGTSSDHARRPGAQQEPTSGDIHAPAAFSTTCTDGSHSDSTLLDC